MKVLIIINNLGVGGAERLVVDDVNEMLARGVDIELITLKPEKEGKTLAGSLKLPEEKWARMDFGSLLNIGSWMKVCRVIKQTEPDIIFTHLWYSNTVGRLAGKWCGVRVVPFEHNVYDTLKTGKMFLIDRVLQRLSSQVIAVSQAVKESLIKNGIDERRIKVIRNGIDTIKYQNLNLKSQNSEFTFIFIGRLIRQKAVDILLRAFAKTQNSRLLIVGEGAEKENLFSLAKELGIENRVIFLGIRQDIPELLMSSDCFVLPSRYEGLPMVLLEAVAAHKPIIISDFQSASEVIENNVNGIIVPRENVEVLAQAMNKVVSDVQFRNTLIQNVTKASLKVSIKNHVDQLLNL